MTNEKAIADFNSKSDFLKAMIIGRAARFDEIQEEHKSILSSMYKEGAGFSVVGIIDDYAILLNYRGTAVGDDKEYPYTCSVRLEGRWTPTHTRFETLEEAMLHAIGYKVEGANSHFAFYATKMLKQ